MLFITGLGKHLKVRLLVLAGIALAIGTCLAFPESVVIMRGDYILSKWVGVTETNKSWLMVFFLGLCGACISYITVQLYRRKKKGVRETKN